MLTDSELRDVWRAADKIPGPFGALVKLLVLTGQRRDEVAQLRWVEIDLDNRLWVLPPERTKNGKSHDVPLSEPVIAVLTALPRGGMSKASRLKFLSAVKNNLSAESSEHCFRTSNQTMVYVAHVRDIGRPSNVQQPPYKARPQLASTLIAYRIRPARQGRKMRMSGHC